MSAHPNAIKARAWAERQQDIGAWTIRQTARHLGRLLVSDNGRKLDDDVRESLTAIAIELQVLHGEVCTRNGVSCLSPGEVRKLPECCADKRHPSVRKLLTKEEAMS